MSGGLAKQTCDLSGSTSVGEPVLIGSLLRVDIAIKQVVSAEVWPAGWRLMSQVHISGNTVALTAAVIQTFLHRLRRAVLTGTH